MSLKGNGDGVTFLKRIVDMAVELLKRLRLLYISSISSSCLNMSKLVIFLCIGGFGESEDEDDEDGDTDNKDTSVIVKWQSVCDGGS